MLWAEFQEAVVFVVGDGILITAAGAMAGALLIGMLRVSLILLRRPK